MMLSITKQFIFIRVPKTGIQSIGYILRPYVDVKIFKQKTTSASIKKICRIKKLKYQNIFKFAFVRNPWDRAVSYYHYLIQHYAHKGKKHVNTFLKDYPIFDKFIEFYWEPRFSQWRYYVDENEKIVPNFIGRFENLQDDFNYICNKIEIPKTVLPHLNQSTNRHKDYRKHYTKSSSIDIIAKTCAKEIKYFQYCFD